MSVCLRVDIQFIPRDSCADIHDYCWLQIRETCGSKDVGHLLNLFKGYFEHYAQVDEAVSLIWTAASIKPDWLAGELTNATPAAQSQQYLENKDPFI